MKFDATRETRMLKKNKTRKMKKTPKSRKEIGPREKEERIRRINVLNLEI